MDVSTFPKSMLPKWFLFSLLFSTVIIIGCVYFLTSKSDYKYLLIVIVLFLFGINGLVYYWALEKQQQFFNNYNAEIEHFALIRHFEHIIRYANDIILLIDDNNKILEANDRALDVYGYSREEILLFPVEKLFAGATNNLADKWFTKIRGDKTFFGESIHITKNGNTFPVEISARVIVLEEREFCQAIIRDITERKEAENALKEREIKLEKQNEEYMALNSEFGAICEELSEQNEKLALLNEELHKSYSQIQEINKELIIAKERAIESDNLKSAFLANLSHEIRTPMNGIIGFSEMLAMDNITPEKRKHYIEVIINSTNQLLSIVNDILDLSKIETGQIAINREHVNLNRILLELYSFNKPKTDNKGLQLNMVKGLDDNNCNISTDKLRLNQILNNLVGNAIKFTTNGSITIGYELINNNIQFFVKDTGIGISPENQHLLFGRFQQATSEISRNYGGTGLGLAISKSLVELLHGKVWFKSEPGIGSTFYFTLPYLIFEHNNQHLVKPVQPVTSIEKGLNILLAEDEDINYIFIKEVFEGHSVNLFHARNGNEAIELCKLHKEIELILMDIKMPVLDGHGATKEIRKFRPDVPIIALTAYAMKEDKAKFLSEGFNDYLAKPVRSGELMQCINKNMKKTVAL